MATKFQHPFGEHGQINKSVRGIRHWITADLHSTGNVVGSTRLYGDYHGSWSPDTTEFVAECMRPPPLGDEACYCYQEWFSSFRENGVPCQVCSYATWFHEEHETPDSRCQCGFYAYYSHDEYPEDLITIVGVIEGYGRVLIGTKGFRTQKARILALSSPDHLAMNREEQESLRATADMYRVPAFPTVDLMLKEFPPTRLEELGL